MQCFPIAERGCRFLAAYFTMDCERFLLLELTGHSKSEEKKSGRSEKCVRMTGSVRDNAKIFAETKNRLCRRQPWSEEFGLKLNCC